MTAQAERLLTEKETAAALGISLEQLRALARDAHAPEHFTITVRTIRYLNSSVTDYITRGSRQ